MDDTPEFPGEHTPSRWQQSALALLSELTLAKSADLARAYESVFEALGPVWPKPAPPKGEERQEGAPPRNGLRLFPVKLPNGRRGTLVLLREGPEQRYRGAAVGEIKYENPAWRTIIAVLAGTDQRTPRREEVWREYKSRETWFHERERWEAGDPQEDWEGGLNGSPHDPKLRGVPRTELGHAFFRLGLAEAFLRATRADYDDLPERERVALLEQLCAHINRVRNAVIDLQDFLVRGTPDGIPKRRVADPGLDVRAAELRDATGLPYQDIADILDVPITGAHEAQARHKRVSDMAKRGRDLLLQALGQEGYDAHLRDVRHDLKRLAQVRLESIRDHRRTQ